MARGVLPPGRFLLYAWHGNALVTQWTCGFLARAGTAVIPDMKRLPWFPTGAAWCAHTAGVGGYVPGAVCHAGSGMRTGVLFARRAIPQVSNAVQGD